MRRTIITTLLVIFCITNMQAGKSKGKITMAGKPGHQYSLGFTRSTLPSNTKENTFLTNSLGITANVFFPIIKSPNANFGFNVGGTYDFGGKGNPASSLPKPYNVTGQTSSNVVYRGLDPRSPGFKTAFGPQANFLVGNRFVISPMVPVGYMSLNQKTMSAVQTTSYNGQNYDFNLATLPETKISGITVNPTLRLQYFVSKSVGLWIEGSYLTGPKIKTQLTKLVPNGAANQQGTYDLKALQNASYVKSEITKTSYNALGFSGGIVYTFRVKHQGKHDSGLDDIGDVAVRDGRAGGRGIIYTPNNQSGDQNNTRQKNDTSKINKKEKKATTYTDNLQKEEIIKSNNTCCNGSSWGKIVEVVSETRPTKNLPNCGSSLGSLECGSTKQYKACYNSNKTCKKPIIIKYEIFDNANVLKSSTMASSCSIANVVLPTTTGAYQLKISALVDNKVCNSCNYSFETNCGQKNDSLDLSGCDVDIDSTIVNVACGGIVNITPLIDGTPDLIKYTIYDTAGVVVTTGLNTPSFSYTLPYSGIFYGLVEVSCGGGDKLGGDEDEESFEIENIGPVAFFGLKEKNTCVGGIPMKTFETKNYSFMTDGLIYKWNVIDSSTMTSTHYTSFEPTFTLPRDAKFLTELIVSDTNGCSSSYKVHETFGDSTMCNANFDFRYNWCEECSKNGSNHDIQVRFTNLTTYAMCTDDIKVMWYFSDGDSTDEENPVHTFKNIPCSGKSFNVNLVMKFGEEGDEKYCTSNHKERINVSPVKPYLNVDKICCDGHVYFSTNAKEGSWYTPGSMGKPKWPFVSDYIGSDNTLDWYLTLGMPIIGTIIAGNYGTRGGTYNQYYDNVGWYHVRIDSAMSEFHNVCTIIDSFEITEIECLNRSTKDVATAYFSGITVKEKLRGTWLPNRYTIKSKIKTVGFKKMDNISTNYTGFLYTQDAGPNKCFCTPNTKSGSFSASSKRKAVISTTYTGKYRVGKNKMTGNYNITHSGSTPTLPSLNIGRSRCIRPIHLN